jgi:glycosyltransferase involved in cell wall biosynthesis
MIKLSVCITTYKRADLLDKTLASLAEQTRQPDELIISDDCSPDNTQEIVLKWEKHFPGLIYNRNDRNLYMPGNLNTAVNLAKGEYVANLHDADEFAPTLLEKWELMLDKFPTAGFVFNGVQFVGESGTVIYLHDVDPLTPGKDFYEKHMAHKFSSIVWGTVMARRTAYQKFLPFDVNFGFYSDVDMWIRMCQLFDVAYVREPLMYLDESPTKERKFSWEKTETARRIELTNIYRFYGDQPERLAKELAFHSGKVRSIYMRRLLGRIRILDWLNLGEGLAVCKKLHWPFYRPGLVNKDIST